MSGVELPSYERTKSKAELAEQDPLLTRIPQSEGPKDDKPLKSRRQRFWSLSSQFQESDFGSRRGLRRKDPDLDEEERDAASRYSSPARGRSNSRSLRNIGESSNTSERREYLLDLANPKRTPSIRTEDSRQLKPPITLRCTLCSKRYIPADHPRSHLRTHTDGRPFVCHICDKAFARQHDIFNFVPEPTQFDASQATYPLRTPSPATSADSHRYHGLGFHLNQPYFDHYSALDTSLIDGNSTILQQQPSQMGSLDPVIETRAKQTHTSAIPHLHQHPTSPDPHGSSGAQQAASPSSSTIGNLFGTSQTAYWSARPQVIGSVLNEEETRPHRQVHSVYIPSAETVSGVQTFEVAPSSPRLCSYADSKILIAGAGSGNVPQLSEQQIPSASTISSLIPRIDKLVLEDTTQGPDSSAHELDTNRSRSNSKPPPFIASDYTSIRRPWEEKMREYTTTAEAGAEFREMEEAITANRNGQNPSNSVKARRFGRSVVNLLRQKSNHAPVGHPQDAPTLVSQAQDDAVLELFRDDEHSRSNDEVSFHGWLEKASYLSPDDHSAARIDAAISTAQSSQEDANDSNTKIDSDYCDRRAQSQSFHAEGVPSSGVAEHESTGTVAWPSRFQRAASIFGEARGELERLRSSIDTLEDSAESASDISRSEAETPIDNHYSSQVDSGTQFSGPMNDNERESGSPHGDPGSSRADTGSSCDTGTLDSTAQANGRKRQRFNNADDGGTYAEVCLGEKHSRLPCRRFVCCFRNGPREKCSGTDDTISEVLKKLSEHHDTHVCDRCWVLKVKDEASGLLAHPSCLDHCLSPQCHKTTPTIGHRHQFDSEICKTKTSRVRPGDGEAVYRFIFSLVHPALESPAKVVTAENSLHLGAVPRQGRRKATQQELISQADRYREMLEDSEKQHVDDIGQINRLKQELSDARLTLERDREKTASLDAKMRRVVAILGDSLRTGEFRDQPGHHSLLMRVGEDAPDALSHFSHPSPSPPDSTNGQQPSAMLTRDNSSAAGQCQLFEDAYPMIPNGVVSSKTAHFNSLGARTSHEAATEMSLGNQNMGIDWSNFVDEPGNASNVSAYTDDFL